MKNILSNIALYSFCIVLSAFIVLSTNYYTEDYLGVHKKEMRLENLRKNNKELELRIVKLEILKLKIELGKTDCR